MLPAFGKLDSVINGVQIGACTYSFRDRPLAEAIKAMVTVGLSGCELSQRHMEPGLGQAPREELRKFRHTVSLNEFRKARRMIEDAGILLYGFNYGFREDYDEAEIARGFEMADALGVKHIMASSTLRAARRTAPYAEKAGIVVAMHNHSNTTDPNQFATIQSLEEALTYSKQFAINLDIGHFWAAGFDPVDYLRKRHAKIMSLHLKDRKKNQGPNMPFGQGDTPIREVLELLRDNRYKIPADIEYEYDGVDAVAEVRKSFEYCKRVLEGHAERRVSHFQGD